MSTSKKAPDLYTTLMDASQEAMDSSHFETAYHCLVGALHYAKDMQQADRLDNIGTIALNQLAYINQHAPEHVMATGSAGNRNGIDMYAMLARQAKARAQMARENQRREETKTSPVKPLYDKKQGS
jgi:hypothetical protein